MPAAKPAAGGLYGRSEPGGRECAAPGASGLWDAVLRLPEDQRLAVMFYYYEDMPVAEIAKTLGVAQGTVKSRLSRGRERLRALLREEEAYGF